MVDVVKATGQGATLGPSFGEIIDTFHIGRVGRRCALSITGRIGTHVGAIFRDDDILKGIPAAAVSGRQHDHNLPLDNVRVLFTEFM